MKLVLVIFVAAMVGGYYFLKIRKPADTATDKALPGTDDKRFRAVSIRPGLESCRAARELIGKRFLPDDVPSLPLEGCDEDNCQCRFRHHIDRRDDDDRRLPFQSGIAARVAQEKGDRRERDERREIDDDDLSSL